MSPWRLTRIRLAVVVVVVAVLAIAGGVLYVRAQTADARRHAFADLAAVARLQARMIAAWRAERLADVTALAQESLFADLATTPRDRALRLRVEADLATTERVFPNRTVFLAAPDGALVAGDGATTDETTRAEITRTARARTPLLGDIFRPGGGGPPVVDALAPVAGAGDAPVAVVVLRCDAARTIFPLLESWPVPSDTAAALLVERHGDEAVFLNGSRLARQATPRARLPLPRTASPAVRAALGGRGPIEGDDDRGVAVLAAAHDVHDSPWAVVATMDRAEALEGMHARAAATMAGAIGLALLAGFGASFVYKAQGKAALANMLAAERARGPALREFETTLRSIGDSVITTDANGRVEFMNAMAEELTGWALGEARGRSLAEVFRIVNEDTRLPAENPVTRVLQEGVVVGLANHTALLARNGREVPIADSGAPIRDPEGTTTGVVLVFRDQTAERAAERERVLLTAAIQGSVNEVYLFDAATLRFRFVNQGALRNLGYGAEEMRLMTPLDIKPELTAAGFERVLAPLRDGALAEQRFETVHERKDGSRYPVEVHLQFFAHLGERVFLAVIQDITERRRAAEALRTSEELYHELFARHPSPMWVYDLETYRFLEVNEAATEKYGYTRDEFLAMRLHDIRPPEERPRLDEDLARERPALQHSGPWHHRLRDGSTIAVEIVSHTLQQRGRPAALVMALDITERLETAEALRASEAQLRALFAALPDVVLVLGRDGRCLEVAPAGGMLYRPPEELLGKTVAEVFDGDHARQFMAAVTAAVDSGRRQTFEFTIPIAERERTFAATVVPRGEGTVVLVARDITDHRRAEAQLRQAQKMEAVGTLAGGIAHDFNNLLQALLSLVQAARLQSSASPLALPLAEIQRHIERGAGLTRQLLLFTRQAPTRHELLDLGALAREHAAMLRQLIPETITLEFREAGRPVPVDADPTQIGQVLTNLAVNARDAMPAGGRLTVSVTRDDREAALEVADTGFGMTPEVQQHIFDPFFTTKSAGKGTGLGLAVVWGIAKEHGGRIEVDSHPGRGTNVRVKLPLATNGTAPAEPAPALSDLVCGRGERVLLVEDEAAARDGLTQLLTLLGYTVTATASGEEAAALPVAPTFDLLLTDYRLPGKTGVEVAENLAGRWPGLSVIVMSGYAPDDLARDLFAGGTVHFLQKPFDMATLATALRSALSGKA